MMLRSFSAAFALWASLITTASSAAVPASTFVLDDGDGSNLTFALNLPSSGDDLYFHMSGPAGNDWIAVGLGKEMKGSLMLITYAAADGLNVTVSPRIGSYHSEPTYTKDVSITLLPGSGITNETYVVNGKCSGCRKWKGGSLDLKSKTQPMIYAVGPDDYLQSNALDAGIRRHEAFGQFTMDMVNATGAEGVPTNTTSTSGAASVGNARIDHGGYGSAFHALLMVGTFVILFPLGVLWLRIFEKVLLHWLNQTFAVLVVIVGAGIGIYISLMYNKSKSFNSAHQVIGLIAVLLVLGQMTLGFLHHRIYKKTQQTTAMIKVHRYAGPAVIMLGVINGAIGFNFAGKTRRIIPYFVVAIIVALLMSGAIMLKNRRQRRKNVYNTPAAQNFQEGYLNEQYGSAIPLRNTGNPPAYAPPGGMGRGFA